jgi:archaellum biogenesis protein FlaJ (TadC family)
MRPKLLLRISAFFTLFVAVGHTLGNYTRKATTDARQQEIFKKMADYKFNFGGSMRSWDNFYDGMSLDVSFALVTFTVLLWLISGSANKYPVFCTSLLWVILVCFIGFTILGFMYFFIVPAVCTLLASVLMAAAIYQLRKLSPINSVL